MKEFTRFLERLKSGKLKSGTPRPPEPLVMQLAEREITITLRKHQTARRMTLRLTPDGEAAIITIPKRVSRAEAQGFAERSRPWLEKQIAKRPPKKSFSNGTTIPLRGEPHAIVETGGARGLVQRDTVGREIIVPGAKEHVARRLTDFLKAEAKRDLEVASRHYAALMSAKFKRITIRDQRSRWGSCSTDGSLSYSWRLILTPPQVLDYVAAHEVAHLIEMNHGPRFWRLVLTHCPHARFAKQWLKTHGRDVHSFG
jgi:predicted metal-dependent hydrolase